MRLQTLALSSNNVLCQFVVVHIAPPWPENNVWRLFRPVNAAGTKIPQQQKLVPAVADQCISEFSLWFSFFLFAFLFKHVSRTSSYCVTPLRWKNTSICVRHLVLGCAGTSQKSRTWPSRSTQIELLSHNIQNIVNQAKRFMLPRPCHFLHAVVLFSCLISPFTACLNHFFGRFCTHKKKIVFIRFLGSAQSVPYQK